MSDCTRLNKTHQPMRPNTWAGHRHCIGVFAKNEDLPTVLYSYPHLWPPLGATDKATGEVDQSPPRSSAVFKC